jgi:hypothetical protein
MCWLPSLEEIKKRSAKDIKDSAIFIKSLSYFKKPEVHENVYPTNLNADYRDADGVAVNVGDRVDVDFFDIRGSGTVIKQLKFEKVPYLFDKKWHDELKKISNMAFDKFEENCKNSGMSWYDFFEANRKEYEECETNSSVFGGYNKEYRSRVEEAESYNKTIKDTIRIKLDKGVLTKCRYQIPDIDEVSVPYHFVTKAQPLLKVEPEGVHECVHKPILLLTSTVCDLCGKTLK